LPGNDGGFAVGLTEEEGEYSASFGTGHTHFVTAREALDWVGFMLSAKCRLKVVSRGSWEYKWQLEAIQDDGEGWRCVCTTGTVFPFCRRPTTRYYRNFYLPADYRAWEPGMGPVAGDPR
jgi:hypothetical protein